MRTGPSRSISAYAADRLSPVRAITSLARSSIALAETTSGGIDRSVVVSLEVGRVDRRAGAGTRTVGNRRLVSIDGSPGCTSRNHDVVGSLGPCFFVSIPVMVSCIQYTRKRVTPRAGRGTSWHVA